jgi:hypothetical protein
LEEETEMKDEHGNEITPKAVAKTDAELAASGASAIISEMAQAFKQGNAFTEAGHSFKSDIHIPEFLSLMTGAMGGGVTALKIVGDTMLAARQINAASLDTMTNMSGGIAHMLGQFNAVDQANLGQDRKWNLDEQPAWFTILAEQVADRLVKNDPETAAKVFESALATRMSQIKPA